MKINLKFAEVHQQLFLAGTNLGVKLNPGTGPAHRTGLVLTYDRAEKELLVYWNNEVAIIPSTNVVSMTPSDPLVLGAYQHPAPSPAPQPVHKTPKGAQASTPHSHVFEGPGLTGLEKKL
jgi:hypothetical protein